MGRVLTVTNSNHTASGVRKKTVKRELVIGPTAIKFIAVTIFAILALVYLAQSTSGANRSIKVRDLQDRNSELQLEKERLEVEQTRLKSLKEIDGGVTQEKQVMEPISGAVDNSKNAQ